MESVPPSSIGSWPWPLTDPSVFRSRYPLEHAPSNLLQALLQITSRRNVITGLATQHFEEKPGFPTFVPVKRQLSTDVFFFIQVWDYHARSPISQWIILLVSAVAKKKLTHIALYAGGCTPSSQHETHVGPKSSKSPSLLIFAYFHTGFLAVGLGIAYFYMAWSWMGSMDEFTRNTVALTPRFRGGPATYEESPRRCAWWSRHFVHPGTQNGRMNGAEGACSQEWKQDQ